MEVAIYTETKQFRIIPWMSDKLLSRYPECQIFFHPREEADKIKLVSIEIQLYNGDLIVLVFEIWFDLITKWGLECLNQWWFIQDINDRYYKSVRIENQEKLDHILLDLVDQNRIDHDHWFQSEILNKRNSLICGLDESNKYDKSNISMRESQLTKIIIWNLDKTLSEPYFLYNKWIAA